MALEKYVQPGIRVELFPEDTPKDGEPKSYPSKVSDVTDDGNIEIYMPYEQSKLILLSVNTRYTMTCFSKAGMYECRVSVTNRYRHGSVYLVLLKPISDFRRNQRREFYRYSCHQPMQCRVMDTAEKRWLVERGKIMILDDIPMDNATLLDISGGGAKFLTTTQFKKDDIVFCDIHFGKEYRICGKVLESGTIDDRDGLYRNRIRFYGFPAKEREALIRYIFELEREKQKNKRE